MKIKYQGEIIQAIETEKGIVSEDGRVFLGHSADALIKGAELVIEKSDDEELA